MDISIHDRKRIKELKVETWSNLKLKANIKAAWAAYINSKDKKYYWSVYKFLENEARKRSMSI